MDATARAKILANQQKMQKLMAERNGEIGKQNDQRLTTEMFPGDKISDRWKGIAKRAIMNIWPTAMGIPVNLFAMCVSVDPEKDPISLFVWGVMNNAIEWASPATLGLSSADYHDFVTNEIWPNMQWWKTRVVEIRNEIEMSVAAEFKAKTAAAMTDKAKQSKNSEATGDDNDATGVVKKMNDPTIGQA